MNEEQKKTYLAWLADAHAMELGLVKVLEKQAKETADLPEIHERIHEHLEETKVQAEKIEECLRRNGGDPSLGKDLLSQATAALQGMGASLPSDALVKNIHASYAAEHFEIASYAVLIAAAEEFGDTETAAVCREILAEEEDMAAWLETMLPDVAVEHLETLA